MPLVDLPLAQLRSYYGINPCPGNFDDYWTRGLRELDATPPEAELVPSTECVPADADCFDLWFTGVGGARARRVQQARQTLPPLVALP